MNAPDDASARALIFILSWILGSGVLEILLSIITRFHARMRIAHEVVATEVAAQFEKPLVLARAENPYICFAEIRENTGILPSRSE